MYSFPNQKKYIIEKQIKEGDVFIMLRWDDFCAAAKDLSPAALKLYMYLAKNKDGYEFFFSSKDYCDTFDVVDRTYRNARVELINKGYLLEDGNKVRFSTSADFKETKEKLQQILLDISNKIKLQSEELFCDFRNIVGEANLPEIKDENIYKVEIKELIKAGQAILSEFTRKDMLNLL